MTRFGSARIDENGNISGGKAGDQTGKEVATEPAYVHSQGWRIFRPKDGKLAYELAVVMIDACHNDNIGYDQNNRYAILDDGVYSETPTECDCTSLVRECVWQATKNVYGSGTDTGDFYTVTEPAKLMDTGLFDEVTFSSLDSLYDGDILVTKTKGHTVIVTDGKARKTEPAFDAGWYKVTTDKLNVRSAADSTSDNVVGSLDKNDVIHVGKTTLNAAGNTWGQIDDDTYSGNWVAMRFGGSDYVSETSKPVKAWSCYLRVGRSNNQLLTFTKDGDYYQISTTNGSCLDVKDGIAAHGQPVRFYLDNDTDAQRWQLVKKEDEYSVFYNVVSKLGNYALAANHGSIENGTGIVIGKYDDSEAQRWYLVGNGSGKYRLLNRKGCLLLTPEL